MKWAQIDTERLAQLPEVEKVLALVVEDMQLTLRLNAARRDALVALRRAGLSEEQARTILLRLGAETCLAATES